MLAADSGANFKYSQIKAELDYKKQGTANHLHRKFMQPVKLINGKYKDYTVKKGYKLDQTLTRKGNT
jgi:hypothetical protein